MTTAIEKLKQKYSDEIKRKEAELSLLKSKLSLIEEVASEAQALDLNLGSNKFAGKGMTEVVLSAVHEIGDAGATAGRVKKYMLANGFQTASHNVAVGVSTTLKRLSDKGKIRFDVVDGKRLFKPLISAR